METPSKSQFLSWGSLLVTGFASYLYPNSRRCSIAGGWSTTNNWLKRPTTHLVCCWVHLGMVVWHFRYLIWKHGRQKRCFITGGVTLGSGFYGIGTTVALWAWEHSGTLLGNLGCTTWSMNLQKYIWSSPLDDTTKWLTSLAVCGTSSTSNRTSSGIGHSSRNTHKSEAVDSYSGTSLIRTPLGPSFSGQIIEVSSFQGYSVGVA